MAARSLEFLIKEKGIILSRKQKMKVQKSYAVADLRFCFSHKYKAGE